MNKFNSKSAYTVILYSKEDAVKFLEDQPKADRVYPLTPEARAQLFGKTDLPVLDPMNYFKDYSHRRILARVRRIEKTLHPIIYQENNLSGSAKESFRGIFHPLACTAFYLWYLIRDVGPWLINYKNSWCYCDELTIAHKMIFNEVSKNSVGIFKPLKQSKVLYPRLYRLINYLFIGLLSKKQSIWITGLGYGMNDLIEHLKDENPNVKIITLSKVDEEQSCLRYMKKMIKVVIHKKNDINIIALHDLNKSANVSTNKLDLINDPIIQNVLDTITLLIEDIVVYTESLVNSISDLIKRTKPLAYLAYHMRWMEGAVLGDAAKRNGVKSILISHGSHPHCSDISARYEHKELAQGLLTSALATDTVIQSKCAEKTAYEFMPNLTRQAFQPMMWGYNKIRKIPRDNNQIRTILHAGTYKYLGQRPWIYETSNEFLKGLKLLVEAVSDLDNTRLVIRVRPNLECSVESLRKLLHLSSNIEIKTGGKFLDDLSQADLLISYSSTTIEEALYARKPVGLFGGSNRYRHLPGLATPPKINNRSAVYHLLENNLVTMISSILDAHVSKPLTDRELDGYTWPSNIPDRKEFITRILKSQN